MKTTLITASVLAFLLAGCETDSSAPSSAAANFENVPAAPAATGVHTVVMKIDSSPQDAEISLNGFRVGVTPKEVHLEADAQGQLKYKVKVDIKFQVGRGAAIAMGGGGISAGPRDTSFTYAAGDRPPATVMFNSDMRIDGRTPAPFDTKPVAADATQEGL